MHMADALLSPTVGGVMWGVAAAGIGWCSRKIRREGDERKVPLMGVLGAFVFAAQMINFTIPGTGSSGHIGGGLLLAILVGPGAAIITISSILLVQALFFADGGLLALGCNIFNLGFIPALVAYPLVYRPLIARRKGRRAVIVTTLAALVGVGLGALAVVVETVVSGVAALPFSPFALIMLPIHLAIGLVEGVVTAAIIAAIAQNQPELLDGDPPGSSRRFATVSLALLALLTAGLFSWYSSALPDGLEWSLQRLTGRSTPQASGEIHRALADVEARTAIFPEYLFAGGARGESPVAARRETSLAGIAGGAVTFALVVAIACVLGRRTPRNRRGDGP